VSPQTPLVGATCFASGFIRGLLLLKEARLAQIEIALVTTITDEKVPSVLCDAALAAACASGSVAHPSPAGLLICDLLQFVPARAGYHLGL